MRAFQLLITILLSMGGLYSVSVMLCTFSLAYRVALLKPSQIALEIYLNSLRFPLNILIAKASPYNILKIQSRYDDPLETLQKMSLLEAIPLRLIFGVMSLIINLLFLMSFGWNTDRRDMLNDLANLSILIFGIVCFIWAWRFGHQLKSIEARLLDV